MAKVQDRDQQSQESQVKRETSPSAAPLLPPQGGCCFLRRRPQATRSAPLGCALASRCLPIALLLFVFGVPATIGQTPALTGPAPGSVLPGPAATFTWTTVSSATSYKLMLGITPKNFGHLGIYTAKRTSASTISVRATGLPTSGKVVYASLSWVIGKSTFTSRYAYIAAFRGTSPAPTIDSLSCASASFTGSGTDLCTVKLATAAGKNGATIELAGSESKAVVPDSVEVKAGSKVATFKAEIAAVYVAQTAILLATDGKSHRTFQIRLHAGGSVLELESKSVAFGDVTLNSLSTQSLKLTSTGKNPLIIDSAKIAGKGFRMSGPKFPVNLNPEKVLTLDLEFDPSVAGKVTGELTIASNSVTGNSTVVPLSGTGEVKSYEVKLTWDAPSGSNVSIAGYRVYRALSGSSDFGLLNKSLVSDTSFVDGSVESGAEYIYYVETVDTAGTSSVPSDTLSIAIP